MKNEGTMFKRILVPLDGSKTAEKVLPIVVAEARLHKAVVVLLRVIAPLRQSLMTSPNLLDQVFKQLELIAKDSLEEVAERIRAEGLELKIIIERGQPAQRIHEVAKNESCNLIIIGTHGETGNPRWRSGNVANKIIRAQSPIPVLLITTQSSKQSR
jgi:nucleotide-binding universal stress UspA family protein